MEERCTSSGPSAIRNVRAYEYLRRKGLFKKEKKTYFVLKVRRGRGLHLCQWDVSGHPRAAVHLYSAVGDLADHPRSSDLDHGDLERDGQ